MITPVQQRVFDYVKSYIDQHGYSPSLTEIALGIGISPKSISLISRSVHALVAAGRFRFHKKGYRNIEVVGQEGGAHGVAGGALSVMSMGQGGESKMDLSWLLSDKTHFIFEVKDDSLAAEDIKSGDLLICRHTQHAEEGDMVVAVIEKHDAACNRVSYKIPGRVTLVPSHTNLKPKAYLPQNIEIKGVLVALLRLAR